MSLVEDTLRVRLLKLLEEGQETGLSSHEFTTLLNGIQEMSMERKDLLGILKSVIIIDNRAKINRLETNSEHLVKFLEIVSDYHVKVGKELRKIIKEALQGGNKSIEFGVAIRRFSLEELSKIVLSCAH